MGSTLQDFGFNLIQKLKILLSFFIKGFVLIQLAAGTALDQLMVDS